MVTDITAQASALVRTVALAVSGMGLLMVAACSGSDIDTEPTPPSPAPDTEVQAGFYITVGDAPTSTSSSTANGRSASAQRLAGRATPTDGPYDPGQGYENFIDIPARDFKFLFFTGGEGATATYITEFQVNSIIPVSGTESSKTYQVLGSVPQRLLTDNSFRVMVLANWGHYPELTSGTTTIDQACSQYNALFGFNQDSTTVSADNPIPLYGIKRYSDVTYDAAYFYNLGTIHLIRAYAKVDVAITDPRWSIRSAELTRCHTTGYKAPAGVYDQSDYVHDSYDADYTGAPNVPTSGTQENLKFTRIAADSSLYRIYIPEFRNTAYDSDGTPLTDDNRARIRVRFTDRNTGWESYLGEQYVDFKYYQAPENHPELAGHYFNIMRNYWYRFTLTKGPELSQLDVQIDVQPYASVELEPSFGLERDPIDGYIVLKKDANGTPTLMYDDRFEDYYDFQKYLLKSNYSDQIARFTYNPSDYHGMSGDIWLIKRANGQHYEVGSATAKPSLFYDANTGIYYDFEGTALNLIYSNRQLFSGDISQPLPLTPDSVVEVDRDFQHNDIALLRGESDRVAVFYDFSDAKYKGATDFDISNLTRRELIKYRNGWIEVKPYEATMQTWVNKNQITAAQMAAVKPMYFNLFTQRFYDTTFHSLHSPGYEVDYFVDSPLVALKDEQTGELRCYYNRVTGNYQNAAGTVIPRPDDLRYSRVPIPDQLTNN